VIDPVDSRDGTTLPSSSAWLAPWVVLGSLAGVGVAWAHINLDPLERMAAEADHFPLWSAWQLPFALPGAFFGAFAGTGIGWVVQTLKRMRDEG
jgi:hypothetical protein